MEMRLSAQKKFDVRYPVDDYKVRIPRIDVLRSARGTDEQLEVSGFVGSCYDTKEEIQDLAAAKLD